MTTEELRKTEIAGVGDMSWGTHFCLLYETKQDLLEILVPYFKAGLENNEFCLWVISEPLNEEDARGALRQAVPDLERYLAERSIEILPYDEWYLKGGAFDLHRVIRSWKEKLTQALARGYAGIRVSGNTSWIKKNDWKDFREYEKELAENVINQRVIVLCTFPLAASGAVDILDIAHTHQVAVTMRNGNSEVVETPELKQAKTALKRLSEELEQRVVERTRELAAANEELRKVIDAIPQQIWSGSADGSLDYCNYRWRAYRGLGLEELQGEGWQSMLHPDDRDRVLKAWRESVVNGTPYEQEERHRGADGTYRWFLVRGLPLRDAEGRIERWYGTSTDIEDRKRAEETLRRNEAYLAEAQRLSYTGSFGWYMSSGELFWSEETFRIFAYDRATKPTVKLVLERTHPDDLALVQQTLDRATHDGKDWEFEHRLLMPDGLVKHVHVVAHAVRDESGNLEFVGAVRDVTATKRAEEELWESDRKFHNLVDMIPAAVYMCDPSGRIIYYNRRAVELCGREPLPGETGQRFCLSLRLYLLDGALMPHDQSPMAEALRTGRSARNKEVIIERPDQSRITVLANIAGIKNERGEVIAAINCFEDITERKHTEEALERAFQEIQVLKDQLYQENLALREEIDTAFMFEEIVGTSPALHAVLAHVAKVAPTDATVLITGETGTGKELIARAIHKRSPRSSHPFVSVNCAAIPPSLVTSELFGHEKGAFTSALQRRLGRFELANGGTLFLDEIGELPTETQNALLRVLQEREFERVGGSTPIHVDVRVIAATNRDLQAAIAAGAVRSDLFYRLNVFPIELPPLRDRKDDIPLLVEYFLDRYARKAGKKIRSIHPQTGELLQAYSWPGNIRELQNVIERSVILCETETFTVDARWLAGASVPPPASQPLSTMSPPYQRDLIEAALAESRGRVAGPVGAAAKLGMPPSTLESKIRALKINKYLFKTD